MQFALALRFGCTVDELLHRLSLKEYREWVAYFDEGDPLLDLQAERKADLRVGVMGAVIANCLSTGKKKYQPSDFTPVWNKEEKPRQTIEQKKRAAMKIAAAFKNRR